MPARRVSLALLAATALSQSGCVLFEAEGLYGILCLSGKLFGPRGIGGPCACAILCEVSDAGVGGRCYVGEGVFEICYEGPPLARDRRGDPRGANPTYAVPPDAYFALGSYEAGASASHQVGLGVVPGSFETFSGTVGYPPEFVFEGFGTGPVGTLAVDFDRDGAADAQVLLIGTGADTAFADLDFNGLEFPGVEPTVTHSDGHVFTLALPAGGDRSVQTVSSTAPLGLALTLRRGVLRNPAAPGTYLLEGDFVSVDPDTDGADDSTGALPQSLMAFANVEIGEGPCPSAPVDGCNASFAKGQLALKRSASGAQSLRVKAKKGVTAPGFFGDPTDATSHATCVYDGTGALLLELPVAAGGTGANGKPFWKRKGEKATYKDKSGAAGGVQKVGQRAGRKGAGFDVSARGDALALPALPLEAPITVQHRTVDGGCAQVVFDALSKNGAMQVKASVR